MSIENKTNDSSDDSEKSDFFKFKKMLNGKSISQALNEGTNLPDHMTYSIGPKGGIKITDNNTGRVWYASDTEKQKYKLPQNRQSVLRALRRDSRL
jgi:hypothetical protein